MEAEREAASVTLFEGIPSFTDANAVLFDSAQNANRHDVPRNATLIRLRLRFLDGKPPASHLDAQLLIYVDDLSVPRARVRLADLVRLRGERPLNIRRQDGQVLRVVLSDTALAWARVSALRLEVVLDLDS